jgi:hypothetical protein
MAAAKDLSWIETMVHPNINFWPTDQPMPRNKASLSRWAKYDSGNGTVLEQEVFPISATVTKVTPGDGLTVARRFLPPSGLLMTALVLGGPARLHAQAAPRVFPSWREVSPTGEAAHQRWVWGRASLVPPAEEPSTRTHTSRYAVRR